VSSAFRETSSYMFAQERYSAEIVDSTGKYTTSSPSKFALLMITWFPKTVVKHSLSALLCGLIDLIETTDAK
jgi:hypothetical protein